jgi:hypothetical protein
MNKPAPPPCSFCGHVGEDVSLGFRVMICPACIDNMRVQLSIIGQGSANDPIHYSVPGSECVFCERILTTARFSLRRWIFGICDVCACGMCELEVDYRSGVAQSFEF